MPIFTEFPAVKQYMDGAIEKARTQEFVETILGRRRYLRDINSRNMTMRGFAERNAINAPLQGSAADLIKVAMIHVHDWMKKEKLKSKMILQVHDELVFDAHKDEVELLKKKHPGIDVQCHSSPRTDRSRSRRGPGLVASALVEKLDARAKKRETLLAPGRQ
jgi:DNA polymerase I-like protein with 3'-5' exonuclease and polymerase domains